MQWPGRATQSQSQIDFMMPHLFCCFADACLVSLAARWPRRWAPPTYCTQSNRHRRNRAAQCLQAAFDVRRKEALASPQLSTTYTFSVSCLVVSPTSPQRATQAKAKAHKKRFQAALKAELKRQEEQAAKK